MRWFADWLAGRAASRQQLSEISETDRAVVAAMHARRRRALEDPRLSPLERLLLWWEQPSASNPPELEIRALETRYSVRLPEDFRSYLMATMPKGNEWDDEGTRWFPLADIKPLREECASWTTRSKLDSDKLLVFADYMIWCYAWAIDCSDTENRGKVALITGDDHYVADSFDDFLDRYVRDDAELHR